MGNWGRLDVLGLGAVAVLGLLHLPAPFTGDQAFFTVGAEEMSRGGVLYRDFWDIKQPGIFLFYLLGGNLFGFTEAGIHAFELVVLLLFSAFLTCALKRRFVHPGIASLLPVVTVGAYYAASSYWHLTQLEYLAGCPLLVSVWLTCEAPQFDPKRRALAHLAAGILGGIVLLFKLIFLPMLLVLWVTVLVHAVRVRGEPVAGVARTAAVPLAIGFVLTLGAAAAWFAHQGTLGLAAETFFVLPTRIVARGRPEFLRLAKSVIWFGAMFAPLVALGGWRACRLLKFRRADDPLEICLLFWVFSGTGVILLQRQSWWQYHFLLLVVPLGILMLLELDERWGRWKEAGRIPAAAMLALLVLLAPMMFRMGKKTIPIIRQGGAIAAGESLRYRTAASEEYRGAIEETRFLTEADRRPGAIFVGGDPLYYFLSGRPQAVAMNGWSLEFYLPEQWIRLAEQLEASRPPYIFLNGDYGAMARDNAPRLTRLLESDYAVHRSGAVGTWYARKAHP